MSVLPSYPSGRKRKLLCLGEAPLGKELLQEWVTGIRPATSVQRLSQKSVDQEREHASPTMRNLAAIGNKGRETSHCERDLLVCKLSQRDSIETPAPYDAKIIYKRKRDMGTIKKHHSLICPHDWFSTIFLVPVLFQALFLGPPGAADEFWAHEKSWPPQYRHKFSKDGEDTTYAVPFALHGDDAGIMQKEKLLVLHMHSILPHTDGMLEKLLITVMPYAYCVPDITINELLDIVRWSMASCYFGIHPDRDHLGKPFPDKSWRKKLGDRRVPLAGGHRLTWSHIEGDWKFHKEVFHLSRNYSCNCMCHICAANKSVENPGMCYTNIQKDAEWRFTFVTTAEHLASLPADEPRCPLYETEGFEIYRIYIDSMHAVDLGVNLLALGNLFLDFCLAGCFGQGSINVRLERLWQAYIKYCDDNDIQDRMERFTQAKPFK